MPESSAPLSTSSGFWQGSTGYALSSRRTLTGDTLACDETIVPPSMLPAPSDVEHVRLLILAHGASLRESDVEMFTRHFEHGAYSAALELIGGEASRAPKNLSLRRLYEGVRALCFEILEERVGGVHRRVSPGKIAPPQAPVFTRLVVLAEKGPTIRALLRSFGGDPLLALEQTVRLVRHRCLLLHATSGEHAIR